MALDTLSLPTIGIAQLRVGMYIHLELKWTAHPFALSSFRIASPGQIATLRALGLQQVRWDPERSRLRPPVPPAADPDAADDASADAVAEASFALSAAMALDDGDPPGASAGSLPPPPATARARRQRLAAQRAAEQHCHAQYALASQALDDIDRDIDADPAHAGREAATLTHALLGKLLTDSDPVVRLLSSQTVDSPHGHALNVAVIALLLGRRLGLGADAMLELGVGALLHDIGKRALPPAVRRPGDADGEGVWGRWREHVGAGVRLGRRMGLRDGALRVIAQHHEAADGSGFPSQQALQGLDVGARIVALVDQFDVLCSPQRTPCPLTPHEAIAQLFTRYRERFDPAVLNAFVRIMGVYPVGSVVQLTDDRHALVVAVSPLRPLRPQVLVHDAQVPRDEALLVDLAAHDSLGIRRSLRPQSLPPDAMAYLAPRAQLAFFFDVPEARRTAPQDTVFAGLHA